MESLPWPNIGIGSGWLFVGFGVWLILTGKLIPKSTHDREMSQLESQVGRAEHDGAEWRTEGRIKDQQLIEKDIQLRHMEEVGKTVNAVMRSIQALRRLRPVDEDDGA